MRVVIGDGDEGADAFHGDFEFDEVVEANFVVAANLEDAVDIADAEAGDAEE